MARFLFVLGCDGEDPADAADELVYELLLDFSESSWAVGGEEGVLGGVWSGAG